MVIRYQGLSGELLDVATAGLLRRIHEAGGMDRKDMLRAAAAAGLRPDAVDQHLTREVRPGGEIHHRLRNDYVLRLIEHASPGLPIAMRRPLLAAIEDLALAEGMDSFIVAEAHALADAGAQAIFSCVWSPAVVAGGAADLRIPVDAGGPGADLLQRALLQAADPMRQAWFNRGDGTVDDEYEAGRRVWRPLPLASIMTIVMDPSVVGDEILRKIADDSDYLRQPSTMDWRSLVPDWFYEACAFDESFSRTDCFDMDETSNRLEKVCGRDIEAACSRVVEAWSDAIDMPDFMAATGQWFPVDVRQEEIARLGRAVILAAAGAVAPHGLVVLPKVSIERSVADLMRGDGLREAVDWDAYGETEDNCLVWELPDGSAMTAPASRWLDRLLSQKLPIPSSLRDPRSRDATEFWNWFEDSCQVPRVCPEAWTAPSIIDSIIPGSESAAYVVAP